MINIGMDSPNQPKYLFKKFRWSIKLMSNV